MTDKLLNVEDVCAYLGVHRRTLYDWWATGRGPRRAKLPNGRVVVRASVLEDWVLSLEGDAA